MRNGDSNSTRAQPHASSIATELSFFSKELTSTIDWSVNCGLASRWIYVSEGRIILA